MLNYKGIAYPLTKNPEGFFHNSLTDLEQLKSNLAILILTEPGERVMMHTFGCALRSVNLNAPIQVVEDQFKRKVLEAINRWETRIQVQGVNVNLAEVDNEHMLMISIYFIDPSNNHRIEELHIQKSLGVINERPF